jgi:hypothetical protein
MALQLHPLDGEVGVLRLIGFGTAGIVATKVVGAIVLAGIVNHRRLGRRRSTALILATVSGIIGTLANLTAL